MLTEDYVNLPWATEVEPEVCDGRPCFVARNPELGSCIGQGDTEEEARKDLVDARRDLIGVMLECGDPILPLCREFVRHLPQTKSTTGVAGAITVRTQELVPYKVTDPAPSASLLYA